jgi:hypothetical protein
MSALKVIIEQSNAYYRANVEETDFCFFKMRHESHNDNILRECLN